MNACDSCLKRGHLIGLLGPRIAELSKPRARRGVRLLLTLPDDDLIYAVAGERAHEVFAEIEQFRPNPMRAQMRARRVRAVCMHDDAYPARLRNLADPPNPLFVRSETEALAGIEETPTVAIVGGRKASTYALEVAHELGRGLAVSGVPVISGLALGVDAAAHRGALAGRGSAIAVLGSGADVPYPNSHRQLYAEVASKGAVISELPPGTTARRWAFPARNRIMAALVEMVVVVEAKIGSGTLITAEFAESLPCQIGVVPGRVNAEAAAGSNKLLADGAMPVLGVESVLDALFGVGQRPAPPPVRVKLDPAGRAVLAAVEAGDSPLAARDVHIKDVRAALGRLEVLGLVRRDGLGGYERTGLDCVHA
jgi:DNA processing protein